MSQTESGYRSTVKAFIAPALAILFGPWLLMVILSWVFSPRTGSWGVWPHLVGGGWALLVLAYVVFELVRRRS